MKITQIKTLLSLSQVLTHYGLTPDKNARLHCPFHDDKTPSLQIYPDTNTCYCFSTNCSTHGKSIDVIDFIMYMENCSKHEAILKAKEMIEGVASLSTLSKTEVLEKIFTYFQKGAQSAKPAQEYLSKRKLDISKTEVGYNSGQFHHGKRKDEGLIKSYIKYGLLLDTGAKSRTGGKSYGVFGKYCIVFPLRNRQGEIASLYLRSTREIKTQRHFYLKGREGLYPHYPAKDTKKLILTESIIDAASLLEQDEIKNEYSVLALYGTNGFTVEHDQAIKSLKELEEIIFFLNGDAPGKKAAKKYADVLQREYSSLKISEVIPPENEDVNSLLQGHEPNILSHLIKERKPINLLFSTEYSTENKKWEEGEQTYPRPELFVPTGEEQQAAVKRLIEESQGKQAGQGGLDTSNPLNIKYAGNGAIYEIKGFKQEQLDSLKISLQIIDTASGKDHRCKLDLYEWSHIKRVVNVVSERLCLRSDLVEQDLSKLTNLLEEYKDKQEEKQPNKRPKIKVSSINTKACINFLSQPNLLEEINKLIGKAGITGEENSRLLLFVIASSYKMPDTLHGLIQGSSGSGKTRLLKVISDLMPAEDVKRYTRVTDNSFYNQEEYFFVNQLVCFEDLDGLKEDAQLAVRELQSNEILRTSTSIKDAKGSIRGGERVVRGPIASLACTTKGEIYEDNISRCFLVAVDESKAQTMRIIRYQNEVAAGLIDKIEQKKVIPFMRNCIRLLKPYEVVNPYAHRLALPKSAHKIRRLNELYQSFVRQLTLLHQYQRKRDKLGRLITEKDDLQLACNILFESIILKVDELDGSLRSFFEKLKDYVVQKGKDYEFNRFEVREATGTSRAGLHRRMQRLVELEYVRQYGYANRGYRYKINHWDNQAALRAKIRDHLLTQVEAL